MGWLNITYALSYEGYPKALGVNISFNNLKLSLRLRIKTEINHHNTNQQKYVNLNINMIKTN